MDLNPGQQLASRLLTGEQRHTCLVGGSRSGKTTLLVRAVGIRAIRAEHSRHAILRFRGNAARSSISLDTLPKVFRTCFPSVELTEKRQDGYFILPNKSEIWIGGLDDKERVEKILGQEYSTIFLNECSQIPYSSVLVAMTRLAQVCDGIRQRAYYDLNPVGKSHWTNQLFGEHRDPSTRQLLKNAEDYARIFLNPDQNRENLSEEYLRSLDNLPEKQRKRFYEGLYIDDLEGALWTYDRLGVIRCEMADVPQLVRIVVSVDPSGARGEEDKRSDEIGIVVVGLGSDGRAYVLEDLTCRLGPAGWARRAVDAYHRHKADAIIGEVNYGGAMVEETIRAQGPLIPFREVHASRGKHVRAEPIASLYEEKIDRVRHVGRLADLEDQLCMFTAAGYTGERSPDRADALIWGLSHLMILDGVQVIAAPDKDVTCDPIEIPAAWPRVYALSLSHERVAVVWGAVNRQENTVYLYAEYSQPRADLAVHAAAIRDRAKWVPGVFAPRANGRPKEEGIAIYARLEELELSISAEPFEDDAAIEAVKQRIAGNRLRIFKNLSGTIAEYRSLRRDDKGNLSEGSELMSATALLCSAGVDAAIVEPKKKSARGSQSSQRSAWGV